MHDPSTVAFDIKYPERDRPDARHRDTARGPVDIPHPPA